MKNYLGTVTMIFATMGAALGCYTLSLKVSGERQSAQALRMAIVRDSRDIRNLQAELRTRARLPELERWNGQVWKMSAPAAGQYLRSPIELASFSVPKASAQPVPAVQYAVAGPTSPAALLPANGGLIRAAYHVPAKADLGGVAPVETPPAADGQ